MPPTKVNLAEKLSLFEEYWSPKIVGEINDAHAKLVKVKGEFVWHKHDAEDEMFLVIRGAFLLKFRDGDLWLREGEFVVVPRGVEHCPAAPEEVHLMLFEPKTATNTGDVGGERTVIPQWI